MSKQKVYRAIGLMSGTSADGVDAALVETDGYGMVKPLQFHALAYEEHMRQKIRSCFGLSDKTHPDAAEIERLITYHHAACVKKLMEIAGVSADDIDVIGFHGQTLLHAPEDRLTWQVGDGRTLARETGVQVVNNFRMADIEAGGQGAPFLPLYHQARARAEGLLDSVGGPVAVLNIGGVANVTWIGKGEDELIAFDTGPGNALMDDYLYSTT